MSGDSVQDMLMDGQWLQVVQDFLTAGGDPSLEILMPTAIYGAILLSLYIYSSSLVIPMVLSVIFAGVLFAVFPPTAANLVMLGILFAMAADGFLATRSVGR